MTRSFDAVHVGDELPARSRVVTRDDVRAYADASGDRNPLHLDDGAARAAGFPGIIAHGMFTMGHLASSLLAWGGEGAVLLRLQVQFRSPVFMEETIVAGAVVVAVDPELWTATLDVWVKVVRDGAVEWPIRRGRAEVRLA